MHKAWVFVALTRPCRSERGNVHIRPTDLTGKGHLRDICWDLGIWNFLWRKNRPLWWGPVLVQSFCPWYPRPWASWDFWDHRFQDKQWTADRRLERWRDHCAHQDPYTGQWNIEWTDHHNQAPCAIETQGGNESVLREGCHLNNNHHFGVVNYNIIKVRILKSQLNSRLTGHPGQTKMLTPLKRDFMWIAMAAYVPRYVNCCDSCQTSKSFIKKWFITPKRLKKTSKTLDRHWLWFNTLISVF